ASLGTSLIKNAFMRYQMMFSLLLLSIGLMAQSAASSPSSEVPPTKKIKIYLLGTFHFAQTDDTYNVLAPQHQKSIEELCNLVAQQKIDKVFVERQPEFEFRSKNDSLFRAYVKTDALPARNNVSSKNEIYQLGFRIAKKLGHPKVYQCDNPSMYGKYYRPTLDYATSHNQLDILDAKVIGTTPREDDLVNEDSLMMNSSLLDYMRWINSDEVMNTLHANYLTTFPRIGSTNFYDYDDDNTLIGAELLIEWYRRNIMIYGKIINQLDYTEDGMLLIMGGDHIPILKSFFRDIPFFEVVHVNEWLY
ncbi:MAG: DUF5694 domain-containing protein, partial [Bacteroidota bacterium]